MKPTITLILTAIVAIMATSRGSASEFTSEPPPDEILVRQVEERVELLRKWRVIEAIDPSPDLADRLFPLLSDHDRRQRELNHEREQLSSELRRGLYEERPKEEHLHEILVSLTRIRDERCALEKELDEALARLLTVEQQARLTVVLDDFHREVQQLIQRARRPPEEMHRDPLLRPSP